MKKRLIWVALPVVVLAAVAFLLIGWFDHWYLAKVYWSKTQPIHFYGKVVDQSGNPLCGATVSLRWTTFDWGSLLLNRKYMTERRLEERTDNEGRFELRGVSGIVLYVDDVRCDGYAPLERHERGQPDLDELLYFGYRQELRVPWYVPDPSRPAVIPVHRPNEPRVLMPQRGGSDVVSLTPGVVQPYVPRKLPNGAPISEPTSRPQ